MKHVDKVLGNLALRFKAPEPPQRNIKNAYTAPVDELPDEWDDEDRLNQAIAIYTDHLRDMQRIVADSGLGVTLDISAAIVTARSDPARVIQFFENDLGGRVFENQMRTAFEAFGHMIFDPFQCGVILGSMQSGKTGTSACLHFFAPIFYLKTGFKICPVHLLTNFASHEHQTLAEVRNFYEFYGDIGIKLAKGTRPHEGVNAQFRASPTLGTYRRCVLRSNDAVDNLFIRRRTHGWMKMNNLREEFIGLRGRGLHPIVIVDECQHGASESEASKKVSDEDGPAHRAILSTSRAAIQEAIGDTKVPFVCLSATPWDLDALTRDSTMWQVRQRLAKNYVGFNMFLGKPLDPTVSVVTPNYMSFEQYGKKFRIPKLKYVNINMYNNIQSAGVASFKFSKFEKWAHKFGYTYPPTQNQTKTLTTYCAEVEDTLRKLIYAVAKTNNGLAKNGETFGFCIRLCNSNKATNAILTKLALDPRKVDVVPFFEGVSDKLGSVKQILKGRLARRVRDNPALGDAPYMVLVTARARMGDSFPISCEHFIDFSNSHDTERSAATMNALLQGLLGRACGVGKNSTVCLSPANVAVIDRYVNSKGRVDRTPSRHSLITQNMETQNLGKMAKVTYGMHPVLDGFLDRVNAEIIIPTVRQNSKDLVVDRSAFGLDPYVPIMRIAEESGALALIEANPGLLADNMEVHNVSVRGSNKVRIARIGDTDVTVKKGVVRERQYAYPMLNGEEHPDYKGYIYADYRSDEGIGKASALSSAPKNWTGHDAQIHRARKENVLIFQMMIARVPRTYKAVRPKLNALTTDQGLVNRRAVMVVMPFLHEVTLEGSMVDEVLTSRAHWSSYLHSAGLIAEIEQVYAQREIDREEREAVRSKRRADRETA
jgi:hypothetical protein